jgi:hypothetical protein
MRLCPHGSGRRSGTDQPDRKRPAAMQKFADWINGGEIGIGAVALPGFAAPTLIFPSQTCHLYLAASALLRILP